MKTNKAKTIGRVLLSLAIIVCVCLDCWGLYIHFYAPEKINSYTFKLGQQTAQAYNPETGEVTEDTRWFAEVNIYDNCYEILFNYFTDENRTEFYSQGLQFYTNSSAYSLSKSLNSNYSTTKLDIFGLLGGGTSSIVQGDNYEYHFNSSITTLGDQYQTNYERKKFLLWTTSEEYDLVQDKLNVLTNKYYLSLTVSNFSSSNNYEDVIYSSNPFNDNTFFTVGIKDGDDTLTYKLQLKGSELDYLKDNSDKFYLGDYMSNNPVDTRKDGHTTVYYYDHDYYYRSCDIYWLAELIYNSCDALDYSTTGIPITFEFGDYFNYYDETGTLINNTPICDKVENYVKSYWQINVQKHQGNMTKASQSLFKTFKGTTSYDEAESEEASSSEVFNDYHHGRTILDLNENYFDKILIQNNDNTYKLFLSLKEEFKQFYPPNSKYRIRVTINLDNLNYSNITYSGLVDGTLDGYSIYQIKITSTATGELVETIIT